MKGFLSYSLISAKCEGKPHRHLPCPPPGEESALRRSWGRMEAKYPTDVEDESQVLITQIPSTCHASLPHKLATTPTVIPENETPLRAHPTHPTLPPPTHLLSHQSTSPREAPEKAPLKCQESEGALEPHFPPSALLPVFWVCPTLAGTSTQSCSLLSGTTPPNHIHRKK